MARLSLSEAVQLAESHYRSGRLDEAAMICQSVLQASADDASALHLLGRVAAAKEDLAAAEHYLRRAAALSLQPASCYNDLSLVLHGLGRIEEAEGVCRHALVLDPQSADVCNTLGVICLSRQSWEEAEAAYRQAVSLRPDSFISRMNLANVLQRRKQFAAAVEEYRRAIPLQPDYALGYLNLGAALQGLQRQEEAVTAYRELLRLDPRNVMGLNNLGVALQALGNTEQARAVYRQSLAVDPRYAPTYFNLGTLLQAEGLWTEAESAYRQAMAVDPRHVGAMQNLGQMIALQMRFEEAEAFFRQAIAIDPRSATFYSDLGNALQCQGRLDEAEAAYRQSLALDPLQSNTLSNCGANLLVQGRAEEALEFDRRALDLDPKNAVAQTNCLMVLQYLSDATPAAILEAHSAWGRKAVDGLPPAPVLARDPIDGRPLRVGFVSSDFYFHPVARLLTPLLENLDKRRIEAYGYDNGAHTDEMSMRIRNAATAWRPIRALDDDKAVSLVRSDRLDVLLDLAGHTNGNRLGVFARRAAPIQITWLGYEGTTGLPTMDYLLADLCQVPYATEAFYCERILRMPEGYVCFEPPADAPDVNPLPALERGYPTFGSFNNPAKLNRDVVSTWSEILRRAPKARLILKYRSLAAPGVQERFRRMFAAHEIDPERIEFLGNTPHAEALAVYHRIDVALDPFPFSGSLTTCDALWMGVPVITWPGRTFPGRHSLDHLTSVGFTSTVAEDRDHYVDLAVQCVEELDVLAMIRSVLRGQMQSSPLCNGPRFAEHFTNLLRRVAGQS